MEKSIRYSKEFKAGVVARMKDCTNIRALAAELNLSRQALYVWRYELQDQAAKQLAKGAGRDAAVVSGLRQQVSDLKGALADKTLEVDFFKGALQRFEDRRRRRSGEPKSTTTSQT